MNKYIKHDIMNAAARKFDLTNFLLGITDRQKKDLKFLKEEIEERLNTLKKGLGVEDDIYYSEFRRNYHHLKINSILVSSSNDPKEVRIIKAYLERWFWFEKKYTQFYLINLAEMISFILYDKNNQEALFISEYDGCYYVDYRWIESLFKDLEKHFDNLYKKELKSWNR